jgi:hypothetical protein
VSARRRTRSTYTRGRITLLAAHEVAALPKDWQVAVAAFELHLWDRYQQAEHPPLEVLDDGGVGVFLTVGHMQALLRRSGSRKTGEKFAAEIINTILPTLGLIENTDVVKKPRVAKPVPQSQAVEGGRHAQPTEQRAFWWRVFKVPALSKLVGARAGAYPPKPGVPPVRHGSASLVALLRCQGLQGDSRRVSEFSSRSVQAAFWATGPP